MESPSASDYGILPARKITTDCDPCHIPKPTSFSSASPLSLLHPLTTSRPRYEWSILRNLKLWLVSAVFLGFALPPTFIAEKNAIWPGMEQKLVVPRNWPSCTQHPHHLGRHQAWFARGRRHIGLVETEENGACNIRASTGLRARNQSLQVPRVLCPHPAQPKERVWRSYSVRWANLCFWLFLRDIVSCLVVFASVFSFLSYFPPSLCIL